MFSQSCVKNTTLNLGQSATTTTTKSRASIPSRTCRKAPAAATAARVLASRTYLGKSHQFNSEITARFHGAHRLSTRTMCVAAPAASKQVKVVEVDLGDRTYPIYIGSGLNWAETLKKHIPGNTVLVVTNETIAPLYLDRWESLSPQEACRPICSFAGYILVHRNIFSCKRSQRRYAQGNGPAHLSFLRVCAGRGWVGD
jgi:hypothetical protein